MDTVFTRRVKNNLVDKRHSLTDWLVQSSDEERDDCLACGDESCVRPHLELIETSLTKIANEQLGVCEVCSGKIEQNLIEYDYTSSICLECMPDADRIALENELELSRQLQRAFMGAEIPAIPGMEVAVFSRPAQVLSGDYFDVLQFQNGDYGLVVADAVGHGLPASIVMTSLQTAFRTLTFDSHILEDILTRIHHLFVHNINFTIFATVFFGSYNPATHDITYCNAGHHPPLLFRQNDSIVKWLNPTGPAVGIIENYHIHPASERLFPGDVIVLYSDGVTDTLNPQGEEFGRQHLEEIVLSNHDQTPKELIERLKQGLHDFAAGRPIEDDTTVVVCKIQA